ncbi:MAG TPA: hypothetical protein VF057_10050 [Thermoanaerobaculia bacterium]
MKVLGAFLLVAYFALLVANACFFASGPDTSGYLNQARLIAKLQTAAPIEPLISLRLDPSHAHLFTPYGFAPGRPFTMVATYPAGTSAHLALAAAVAGWRIAPFLVGPLAAVGCLAAIAYLARQCGLPRAWSWAAAVLLGASPPFVLIALQPASDVLATLYSLIAVVCALRSVERRRWAAAAGLAFAIGVAVRPTNVLVAVPVLLAMRARPKQLAIAAVAAAPVAAVLLWYHVARFGSLAETGYGPLRTIVSLTSIPPCLLAHADRLASTALPGAFPLGLLAAFNAGLDRCRRSLLIGWFAVFFAFYSLYDFCGDWSSSRFLLPAFPPLIIGFLLWARSLRTRLRLLPASLVLIALSLQVVELRERRVFAIDEHESIFPRTVAWVEQQVPRDAVVLSSIVSGAYYYHADRITLRWDQLDATTADGLRDAYPSGTPWYAVVSTVEGGVERLNRHAPRKWVAVGRLRDVTLWRSTED